MVKCDKCGTENTDEDAFCSQCGKPLSKEKTTNKSIKSSKLNLKVIVPIAAIILIAIVGFTILNSGNDVTVKDVRLTQYNNHVSDLNEFIMRYSISFVPNKDIDHITNIALANAEVTWGNEVRTFSIADFKYNTKDGNNINFKSYDALFKDDIYYFSFELLENSVPNRQDISHIKGDIVVNTTTQDNVVIGHVDSDINLDHTKKNGQQSGVPRTLTYY